MQNAETVLDVLRERGRKGLPLEGIYRQLFNPQLYLLAYGRIYSNKGSMTPGPDAETADGMTLAKIERIIDAVRHERFRFRPVRRRYIPKKDGKQRPLGLPSWSDKLLGEVIRLLLEAYYEPQFSDCSHGYRPGRGCHTALREVANTWTGTSWFVEGDISQCFDRLDHQVTLATLGEKVHDSRLLRLIGQMLRAGYLEDWVWNATLSGAPQGGVLSPCLSNIYLDRLDTFVETILIPGYNRGVLRRHNPEYQRVQYALAKARVRGDHAAVRVLRKQQRSLPSHDPQDPGYRRLRYVRYADDILLGFTGPKAEAEEIKRRLGQFLREDLKLELSEHKTLITHASTSAARFLGYEITAQHDNRKQTAGRRSVNGQIRLRVPMDVIKAKCSQYMKRGQPADRSALMNEEDHAIINRYAAEYRGIVQYSTRRRRLPTQPAALGNANLAAQDAGRQVRLDSHEDGPQVPGHDRDTARAAQMPTGPRRPQQGPQTTGRNVRWYPAPTTEARGPQRPQAGPGHRPPQGADHPAPEGTVRALRTAGRGASPPDPTARLSRQARDRRTTRMGEDHGQAATQDPRGLRALPRRRPPPEANRVNHGIVTGEPGDRKRSRRVRQRGRWKRTARHLASVPISPARRRPAGPRSSAASTASPMRSSRSPGKRSSACTASGAASTANAASAARSSRSPSHANSPGSAGHSRTPTDPSEAPCAPRRLRRRREPSLTTTRESIRDLTMSSPSGPRSILRRPGSHDENRSCGHPDPRIRV
jgi:group II intron reverse transcriptase/maturase